MDLATAIVTLASASIGFLGALLKEHLAKNQERKTKELEWKKEYHIEVLAEPVIQWIDETLALMEKQHRAVEFGTTPNSFDRMFANLEKTPAMRARIDAFNDTKLSQATNELSESIIRFSQLLAERKTEEALNELTLAIKLAGTILQGIGPKPS